MAKNKAAKKKVKLTKEQRNKLKLRNQFVKEALKFYNKARRINKILKQDLEILEDPILKVESINVRNLNIANSKALRNLPINPEIEAVLNSVRFFDFKQELLVHEELLNLWTADKKLNAKKDKLSEKFEELSETFDEVEAKAKRVFYENGAGFLFHKKMDEAKKLSKEFVKQVK